MQNELFTDYWYYTIIGGLVSLIGIFLVIKNKKELLHIDKNN